MIIKELELYSDTLKSYDFNTLYIGGGTPSLIPLKDYEKLFLYLEKLNVLPFLEEITIEVNPESFNKEKALFYKNLGINRISLGIQSFEDAILKKLGRLSDHKENLLALNLATDLFENYSIDMIYGIPGQEVIRELENIKPYRIPHISSYCLTIVEGTTLYVKREDFKLPEEILNSVFKRIHAMLKGTGYTHYEVSNYARNGYQSMHNMHYWNREHYLGLGAGASGYLKNIRYQNHDLEKYYETLTRGKLPIKEKIVQKEKDILFEKFMLGLRLKDGVIIPEIKNIKKLKELIKDFSKKGLLKICDYRIKPTIKGWLVLDHMLRKIYAIL